VRDGSDDATRDVSSTTACGSMSWLPPNAQPQPSLLGLLTFVAELRRSRPAARDPQISPERPRRATESPEQVFEQEECTS